MSASISGVASLRASRDSTESAWMELRLIPELCPPIWTDEKLMPGFLSSASSRLCVPSALVAPSCWGASWEVVSLVVCPGSGVVVCPLARQYGAGQVNKEYSRTDRILIFKGQEAQKLPVPPLVLEMVNQAGMATKLGRFKGISQMPLHLPVCYQAFCQPKVVIKSVSSW